MQNLTRLSRNFAFSVFVEVTRLFDNEFVFLIGKRTTAFLLYAFVKQRGPNRFGDPSTQFSFIPALCLMRSCVC